MTRFQPPTPPGVQPPGAFEPSLAARPAPWSAAAIAGFVVSLLGCTVIGALVGLILGVVGIVRTAGGRRRGRGLAIAAIPISLVTGALGVLAFAGSYFFLSAINHVSTGLPAIMGTEVTDEGEAADLLVSLMADKRRDQVSAERAVAWLSQVAEKHGTLVEAAMDQTQQSGRKRGGGILINLDGKFVNGHTNITVIIDPETFWGTPKLLDISVDGMSLIEGD